MERGCAPSHTKHIIICQYSNCISIPFELRQRVHCLTVFCLAQFPCEWMACFIVQVDNVTHRGVTRHPIPRPPPPPGSASVEAPILVCGWRTRLNRTH